MSLRCIFCKKDSTKSKSKEHIIPESLGSKNIVLPRGFVCDKCNNYFALKIEKPLLSYPSFRNLRGWYQVPSKKGKLPTIKGSIASKNIDVKFKLDKNKNLDFQPENESEREVFEEQMNFFSNNENANPIIFELDNEPPKKEMSRILAKMALEFLCYRLRNEKEMIDFIIDSNHFDQIRDYARKGNSNKLWPYKSRRIFPTETMMDIPETGELKMFGFGYDLLYNQRGETYFIFVYYGIEYVINLGGPSIKGYEEWLEINNNISPLIERNGANLIRESDSKSDYLVIRGEFDLNKGRLFDRNLLEKYST